jgi:hypothetical protein
MQIATDTGRGYGFNIIDEHGSPVVSFLYETWDDASTAAVNALSLIEKAILVQGHAGTRSLTVRANASHIILGAGYTPTSSGLYLRPPRRIRDTEPLTWYNRRVGAWHGMV